MTENCSRIERETSEESNPARPCQRADPPGRAVAALIGLIALLSWAGAMHQAGVTVPLRPEPDPVVFGQRAYHMVNSGPEVIKRLRRVDHSAIYLLIAGTYTPICLSFFTGFWRWGRWRSYGSRR